MVKNRYVGINHAHTHLRGHGRFHLFQRTGRLSRSRCVLFMFPRRQFQTVSRWDSVNSLRKTARRQTHAFLAVPPPWSTFVLDAPISFFLRVAVVGLSSAREAFIRLRDFSMTGCP